MPEPLTEENFSPVPRTVSTVEAGSHTLAGASAGVELSGATRTGSRGRPGARPGSCSGGSSTCVSP